MHRLGPVLVASLIASSHAAAEPMRLTGVAGYLSEWSLDAKLDPAGAPGRFDGTVTLRHTGLCTQDGPVERTGRIRVETKGRSVLAQISGELFDACSFEGPLPSPPHSFMDCKDGKSYPLSLRRAP